MLYLVLIWSMIVIGGFSMIIVLQEKARRPNEIEERLHQMDETWQIITKDVSHGAASETSNASRFEGALRTAASQLNNQFATWPVAVGSGLDAYMSYITGERWRQLADREAQRRITDAVKDMAVATYERDSSHLYQALAKAAWLLIYWGAQPDEAKMRRNQERLKKTLQSCAQAIREDRLGKARNEMKPWPEGWKNGDVEYALPPDDLAIGLIACFSADPYPTTLKWVDLSQLQRQNVQIVQILNKAVSLLGATDWDEKLRFIYKASRPVVLHEAASS